MNSLARYAIDAHGGLDRWEQFGAASADLVQGGVLWQLKGHAGLLDATHVAVGLQPNPPIPGGGRLGSQR